MKCYLVTLQGQGNTECRIVDEESWNWLCSDSGKPSEDATYWDDPNVPSAVVERRKVAGLEEPIEITSGSWENDRALQCPAIIIDGNEMLFWSVADAIKAAKEHGMDIEKSYEGCIY